MSDWTEEVKSDKVKEIFETFKQGGTYAHNIIRLRLQQLAGHDKKLADETYNKLYDMGVLNYET